jgi:hypothetical protein
MTSKTLLRIALGVVLAFGSVSAPPRARPAAAASQAYSAPGVFAYLPALHSLGSLSTGITVVAAAQNVGTAPTSVALLLFDDSSAAQNPTPVKLLCSPAIPPGSSWIFEGAPLAPGAYAGLAFSFQHGHALGGSGPAVTCDYLEAQRAAGGWPVNWDFYAAAPTTGQFPFDWLGANPFGGQPIAVQVLRRTPGNVTPANPMLESYPGQPAAALASHDSAAGNYVYVLPMLRSGYLGFNSVAYMQNAGNQLAAVTVAFRPMNNCAAAPTATSLQVRPGQSYRFNLSSLVPPGSEGSLLVRSTQPLAIVADQIGADLLASYTAAPGAHVGSGPAAAAPAGDSVLYGAQWWVPFTGISSTVYLHNLGAAQNARVRLTFTDYDGVVQHTSPDLEICPGGSRAYNFVTGLISPLMWLRVESLGEAPQPIAGHVELINFGLDTPETKMAAAYNLVPQALAYPWPAGGGGAFRLALPLVSELSLSSPFNSELHLAHLNPAAPPTRLTLAVFDPVGRVATLETQVLGATIVITQTTEWPGLPAGFRGSAIATLDPASVNAPVGLAGTLAAWYNTTPFNYILGDEWAMMSAIPLTSPGTYGGRPFALYLPAAARP